MEDLKRLQKLYDHLKERGVVDIKWHVDPAHSPMFVMGDVVCKDSPEVIRDKIAVLEQVVAGNYTPFQGMGDSYRELYHA